MCKNDGSGLHVFYSLCNANHGFGVASNRGVSSFAASKFDDGKYGYTRNFQFNHNFSSEKVERDRDVSY